ncbi:hypothetical protein MKX03_033811, partial [Papaver bracteatum]
TGNGKISASGGNGLAGGGGGRVAVNVYSRHNEPEILVHGGGSYGFPENSGAAGTLYDAVLQKSLFICSHNMSTQTDTLLLEFPNQPIWKNVYVHDHARAAVPLLWSRVQVFWCSAHVCKSAPESEMLIDGGGDVAVATSMLEASNLLVLRIGAGSVLQGPLENATANDITPRLYCGNQDCPVELLHPSEDCNMNSSLPFTLEGAREVWVEVMFWATELVVAVVMVVKAGMDIPMVLLLPAVLLMEMLICLVSLVVEVGMLASMALLVAVVSLLWALCRIHCQVCLFMARSELMEKVRAK